MMRRGFLAVALCAAANCSSGEVACGAGLEPVGDDCLRPCTSDEDCPESCVDRYCVAATCDAGSVFDGTSCVDVDECALGTHDCSGTQTCLNEDSTGWRCIDNPVSLYIEAEEAPTIDSPFSIALDADASKGRYVVATGVVNTTDPVVAMSQPLPLPTTGDWVLWARLYAPSATQDAVYVGFDGVLTRVFPSVYGQYTWLQVSSGRLAAGDHEISTGHGETDLRVDAFVVTNDPGAIPSTIPDSVCGNLWVESPETCEGVGACCDAATCVVTSTCVSDDGCCPSTCTLDLDNDCPPDAYSSLADQAVGFAQPTGGADGPRIFVSNLDDGGPGSLRDAVAQSGPKWISFEDGLSGTITQERLYVSANTTIDGRGADITLVGRGLVISGTAETNIIIHNLKFDIDPGAEEDAIRVISGPDNIWIDHCTFDRWTDGAVDVTNGVAEQKTHVTVSWSRFNGGSKISLVSATSDPAFGHVDENLYVTYHHNYFFENSERLPRVRFAKIHTFNNFFYDWNYYAVGASTLSQVIVENNIFDAARDDTACSNGCIGADCNFWAGAGGAIKGSGNLLDRGAIPATCAFAREDLVFVEFTGAVPPYSYGLETADDSLRQAVIAGAGWRDVPLP